MIKTIKKWFDEHKARVIAEENAKRQKRLREKFTIVENGGNVFIMCGDVAVLRVAPNETVATLLLNLQRSREAALEYKE